MTVDRTPRAAAQTAIAQAGFTPTTERNALRLLDCAADENGSVTLTWAALCEIWQLSDTGVARRYLTRLSRAGIIHYSSNEWIYVTFRTWTPTTGAPELPNRRVGTTESARGNYLCEEKDRQSSPAETDANPTPARQNYRIGAWELPNRRVGTTETARVGGDKGGGMNERVHSSPLPGEIFIHSIRPEAEQKSSIAILTDPAIRLGAWKARQIAQTHPFETIRAYCCDFVAQGKQPLDDAGLIDWWLKNEPVPPLVANELYQRHRTPEEIAAEQERETAAAEENQRWEEQRADVALCPPSAPPPPAAPAPVEADDADEAPDIWPAVLSQLASTMPAPTYETWIRDTNLLGVEDGTYTVGVPHASAREYLQSRLTPQIQRAISRQVGSTVAVAVAVRSRGNHSGA